MEGSQLSPAFYICNLPWKILVMPRSRETQEGHRKSLGFFLQCNAESESTSWGCCAIAQLNLLSSIEGQPPFSKGECDSIPLIYLLYIYFNLKIRQNIYM